MTQHINLLPPRRGTEQDGLTLRNVLVAALVGLLAAVGAGAWVVPQAQRLKREADALRAQVAAAQAAQASRAVALDTALSQQLNEARARAARMQEASTRLSDLATREAERFSDYFVALSRQTMPGVWLTAFAADAPDRRLVLAGRALSAELVPGYLQRLQREPAFQSRRFASLDMEDKAAPAAGGDAAARGAEAPAAVRVVEFRLQSSGRDAAVRDDFGRSAR